MKTYVISRGAEGVTLSADGRAIPGDFDYGYVDAAPCRLAYALLVDALSFAPDPRAVAAECRYSFAISFLGSAVRGLDTFKISRTEIVRWFANKVAAGAL